MPVRTGGSRQTCRQHGLTVSALTAALALSLTVSLGAACAQDKTFVMKLSCPTINDATHQYVKTFAAAVEKDSGGRIKTEIYPASQLGSIPRQIEGVQFGSIQAVALPAEFFVGVDQRFGVLAAPALVDSMPHGQRFVADPEVQKLMLGLGADKGIHGIGLMASQPLVVASRVPLRRLADFEGKKIRIFASQFQSVAFNRLGATAVAMSLSDVLPAIQQGTIDGAIAGIGVFVRTHFYDAAKYATETNQPTTFVLLAVSKKWYESLPQDLQRILDRDGLSVASAMNPVSLLMYETERKAWVEAGGELISLPPEDRTAMMAKFVDIGDEVSKASPPLKQAYDVVASAAKRTRQAQSQ